MSIRPGSDNIQCDMLTWLGPNPTARRGTRFVNFVYLERTGIDVVSLLRFGGGMRQGNSKGMASVLNLFGLNSEFPGCRHCAVRVACIRLDGEVSLLSHFVSGSGIPYLSGLVISTCIGNVRT